MSEQGTAGFRCDICGTWWTGTHMCGGSVSLSNLPTPGAAAGRPGDDKALMRKAFYQGHLSVDDLIGDILRLRAALAAAEQRAEWLQRIMDEHHDNMAANPAKWCFPLEKLLKAKERARAEALEEAVAACEEARMEGPWGAHIAYKQCINAIRRRALAPTGDRAAEPTPDLMASVDATGRACAPLRRTPTEEGREP